VATLPSSHDDDEDDGNSRKQSSGIHSVADNQCHCVFESRVKMRALNFTFETLFSFSSRYASYWIATFEHVHQTTTVQYIGQRMVQQLEQ